ncbi:MAG: ABC transporter permease [Zoogloeaceae bacterium]|jgi:ABC-type nitrate/sulfonate/bicarbonate transport system permease component|nr:ABC transporter permease [Zoogloeaceae bacterium]
MMHRPAYFRLIVSLSWLLLSLLLPLVVWEFAARKIANPVLLPEPELVAASMMELFSDGSLMDDILASLQRVFTGFFIASAVAIPSALLMAYFLPLRRLFLPLVTVLRPIPPIAWIPLAILWFGLGNKPSYFITALAAFFPIFLNAFAGGIDVQPRHIHAARFLGAGRWLMVRHIYLMSALPSVWTGLRIGLGQSWMAVVTAELIAAQSGLGYMIQANRINLETQHVLTGMIVIGVLGALMTTGLGWCEKLILPWKYQRQ